MQPHPHQQEPGVAGREPSASGSWAERIGEGRKTVVRIRSKNPWTDHGRITPSRRFTLRRARGERTAEHAANPGRISVLMSLEVHILRPRRINGRHAPRKPHLAAKDV